MEFDDIRDEDDSKTQKILSDREKIKNQLARKLKGLKFSEDEIYEVLDIVDMAEARIEKVKMSLNGTNINNDDPTTVMKIAFDEIKVLQTKMAIDIRAKINEILSSKK